MDIEYTLTAEDYLQLNLHADEIIPAMKARYLLFRWGLPIGALIYFTWLGLVLAKELTEKIEAMLFIGMALLLLVGGGRFYIFLTRRSIQTGLRLRKDSFLLDPLRMLLLPDEVHVSSSKANYIYKWSAIARVTENPTHYFFWLSARDALIVPKRAFQSPEQQSEFEKAFQRYRAAYSLP